MSKIKKQNQSCPDCSNTTIISDYKSGFNICTDCGCTINKIIDEGSEWRSFSDSQDPSRIGACQNPYLTTSNLDTLIEGNTHLARAQLKNAMRGPERGMLNAFSIIETYCTRSSMSQLIIDKSCDNYKVVFESGLTKGKNLESVVAACIHLACKHLNCARTFKEISVMCNVPKEDVGKSYKLIEKLFDRTKNLSVVDIIARFVNDLNLGIEAEKLAINVAKRAVESGCVAGKSPVSIAAAVLYLTAFVYKKGGKTHRLIHYITNVSEVTIKNTYKEMMVHRNVLLDEILAEDVIRSLPST